VYSHYSLKIIITHKAYAVTTKQIYVGKLESKMMLAKQH